MFTFEFLRYLALDLHPDLLHTTSLAGCKPMPNTLVSNILATLYYALHPCAATNSS